MTVLIATAIFIAFAAVYFVVLGFYWLAPQLLVVALTVLGSAIALLHFKKNALVRPRATTGGGGTTLLPDRGLDILGQTKPLNSIALPAAIVLTIFGTLFQSDAWSRRALDFLSGLLLVTLAAAVVLPFVVVLWPQLRWGASKYLRLTPDGVEMGQWLRTRSCRWEDVRSVTDLLPSGVVVTTADGKTLRMTTDTFTPNSLTLPDLVRFYWRHPEARGELTDGVAQRRFEERLGLLPG